MNLHLDPSAFSTLLLGVSSNTGIRADILEKDYYVTLLLEELSVKPEQEMTYFKGGTALYKALKSLRRFSEDIDLTVSIEDCGNNNQAKRRMERATNFTSLIRNRDDAENKNRKGEIIRIYSYDSIIDIDSDDPLHRFERVKVEATSFTVSEPHEPLQIAPLIYELAPKNQKNILRDNYQVNEFFIQTIKLERIFIDKVFAAEFYYLRQEYFDMVKHLYDIVILLKNNRIIELLQNQTATNELIGLKREEETRRRDSSLSDQTFTSFSFFQTGLENKNVLSEFTRMQSNYVFQDKYILSESELRQGINQLFTICDKQKY